MEPQERKRIADDLTRYVARAGGYRAAANSLGVGNSTIKMIIDQDWSDASLKTVRSVAIKIGYRFENWTAVETDNFKMMRDILTDAQRHSNVHAVIGSAGSGKSFSSKHFALNNERVYLLNCSEYWNRKAFMSELLTIMGKNNSGYTAIDMVGEAVSLLNRKDHPLIVMDEVDKLNDQCLYFFITLYNQLEDHCGIVMCATDHLKRRITNGLKSNKKGYQEIYSRIGRKFIELDGVASADIASICIENGVKERSKIKEIVKDSEWDLRRVKRKIHAFKQMEMEAEMEAVEAKKEIVGKD